MNTTNLNTLGAILETIENRDYVLDGNTFLHMKLVEPSNLIQVHTWKSYTTFISNITGNLSFEHEILYHKNVNDDFLVNFFLFDLTNNLRVPCSGFIHSSTENVNTGEHKHTFNVYKNHHYAVGVEEMGEGSNSSIKILKGSKLSIKPVFGSNTTLTGTTTTSLSRSESQLVGQFKLERKVENTIIIRMDDESNHRVKKLFEVPENLFPHNLIVNFNGITISDPVSGNFSITITIFQQFTTTTFNREFSSDNVVVIDPFTLDLGNFNDHVVQIRIDIKFLNNVKSHYIMDNISGFIGNFIATPIKTNTDTLLTSGHHLSLNMGKEVNNPPAHFFLDFRGTTKFKNIQLNRFISPAPYSSFVPDFDMVLMVTFFIEIASTGDNGNKTIFFSFSKDNNLSNPDLIPESKFDILLTGDITTKRFKKEFILNAEKGEHYYLFCSDGGNFKLGKTTMLSIQEEF